MYNVKLKSVPNKAKTGSQLDYSLVDRNTLFLKPNTPVDSDIKNTMGAVPRNQANIEAEGGETVVGDINNDGYLEHQTIVGKRHTQGGVPLNVPEGSFIFSDTKKMMIKDPEILSIFGMKPSKKGYTPAEIAKKYNINDFIAILKDPAKDKYSKETAEIMLQSNLKKLGMLSLVQESMKGFPDGVPAIGQSVMQEMQGGENESQETPEEQGPQEEMQEAPQQRYGGELAKAQFGGSHPAWTGIPNDPTWQSTNKATAQKIATAKKSMKKAADNIKNSGAKEIKQKDGYTGYWDRASNEWWSRPSFHGQADPRMNQALRKLNPFSDEYNGEGFVGGTFDYLGNVFSMPQKEMNHLATGLYETPMTTVARYHDISPTVRFLGDVITDPLIIDEALAWGAKKLAPHIAQASKYVGSQIYKGGKYVMEKAAPYVEKTADQIAHAYGYTKKVWDKIPVQKKAMIISKISQATTHTQSAGSTPEDVENLKTRIKTSNRKTQPVIPINQDLKVPGLLNTPSEDTTKVVEKDTTPVKQQVQYYNPREGKPEDTPEAKYIPATNSAEVKKASEQPVYKVRIKTPPAQKPVEEEIPSGRESETFRYGGGIHQYQTAGTTTEPQFPQGDPNPTRKVIKYVMGSKPENRGKIYAKYDDGTEGENDITKYLKWDPNSLNKRGKKGVMRLELPQSLSFKEKQRLANLITQTGFNDSSDPKNPQNILQSSSVHINPKDYYHGFSGGLTPQDFEDKLVRENFGDDTVDKMSEVTKRREAFKILGIKADESELGDAKKLYNSGFMHNTFYPAFKKLLPGNIYRQLGDDEDLGLDHLDAYKINKPVENQEQNSKKETQYDTYKRPISSVNPGDQGWWAQDRLNFAGAMTDPIHVYPPAMGHHEYHPQGYALNDPTTQIRAIQQGANSMQNQAYNSMSGNTAMAAVSGTMGQAMDQAASAAGNTNNANVAIVNNVEAANNNTLNKYIDQRESDKQLYQGEMAKTLTNLDREKSFNKWRQIAALNTGITNWQHKNQYEDQIDPNAYIHPITGHVTKHGYNDFQLDDEGHFVFNPHQSYASGIAPIDTDSLYEYYKKNGSSHQEAIDKVNLQLKSHAIKTGAHGASSYPGTYGAGVYPGGYGATAGSAYGYED